MQAVSLCSWSSQLPKDGSTGGHALGHNEQKLQDTFAFLKIMFNFEFNVYFEFESLHTYHLKYWVNKIIEAAER